MSGYLFAEEWAGVYALLALAAFIALSVLTLCGSEAIDWWRHDRRSS